MSSEKITNFLPNKTINIIFRKRNEEQMKITLKKQIILYKEITLFLRMTLDSKFRTSLVESLYILRTKK